MGISFFETMSGELIDTAGSARHVAIDIRCDASKLGRFMANGRARVTGTIRARPWTEAAACAGTVVVRPLLGRRIEYDIAFIDDQGRRCRLWGRKDIRGRHPYKSMTRMNARLECDGVTAAVGSMDFHSDDLLAFAKSWAIGPTANALVTGEAAAPGRVTDSLLSTHELETVQALAQALIEPGTVVPAVDTSTIATSAAGVLPYLPPFAVSLYRAGLRTLDAAAFARHSKTFAKLPLDRRCLLLDRLERGGGSLGRNGLFALGLPIKMAHFSRRDYLDGLGIPNYQSANADTQPNPNSQPYPAHPAQPRWMSQVHNPESLDPDNRVECDVLVIGSGAGGSAAAAALAERGYAVVIAEEGRYHQQSEFNGPPEQRVLRYWRDGGLTPALGNTAISVPVGRLVGGTTAINSGTCFRTPDTVLTQWRQAGFPSDFEPEKFSYLLDRVETELQVAPSDPRYLGQIAKVIAKGATELGGRHGALLRNAPGCDGQGICVAGCPTGAKRSSEVSWIPRALRAGAQLYTGLPATRLLLTGRRAVGAQLEGQDLNGAPRRVEIHARAVVVAAGSLLTPLFLRRNGVSLPWLGQNLSIHPALGALARFDADLGNPWQAIPQGIFVEGLGDSLIRFEGFYAPPQMSAPTLPFRGPELTRWMDDWGRVGQYGFMVRDRGVGSVSFGPQGRPLVRYSLTPRVIEAFRNGSAVLAEMLLRGGATEVATLIHGVGSVTDVHQARAIRHRKLSASQFRTMGFHPLGTARMGGSPRKAVVDFNHQVFGYDGLYLADGSCVPTSLGVNPQVTIMAFGLRAAQRIEEQLLSG